MVQKFRERTEFQGQVHAWGGLFNRGMPVFPHTMGNVYYVDSGHANASDNNDGKNPNRPMSTIDAAIGKTTANNGDVIVVSAGHSETLTAAITCDIAGVTIVGLGHGDLRATLVGGAIDYITITAADVVIDGFVFTTPTAASGTFINIAAARAVVRNCRFNQGANAVDAITVTAAGELPTLEFNEVIVSANDPDSWVKFEGVVDRPVIRYNSIIGSDGTNAYDDGVFDFDSVAVTNPVISDNVFNGAGQTITVVANGGSVTNPVYGPNLYVSATSADTVSSQQELVDALYGAAGITTWPASAAPANGVSLAEALRWLDDAVQGANGVVTFPAGAAAASGVSLAEVIRYIQENIIVGTGTVLPSNQSLYDLLAGANGIATFPAAAAAGNGVSLAEVIRYIQETQLGTLTNTGGTATLGAMIGDVANNTLIARLNAIDDLIDTEVGTPVNTGGTASLAALIGDMANDSLAARMADIGSNVDATTTDSVQGKLGTDTEMADRSVFDLLAGDGPAVYPAAAAPANDVSLAEVLREVYNQAEKAASTAAAIMALGDTTVFTIAGGPIEVVELLSICVAANDGTASTLQYQADPTDGAATALSIASASLANATAGTSALCTGTFANAPTITANGTVAAGTTKFIVPAGIIKITIGTGATTGTWTHHLRYRPLSRGVTVS